MIQLLERGGEIWPGHGWIEFYLGSVPYRGIADRLSQTPSSDRCGHVGRPGRGLSDQG